MSGSRKKRRTRRRPGELEADVLATLWSTGEPMSPSEVQAALDQGLAYATVSTILTRLHEKGLVVRTKGGRTNFYEPALDESDHVSVQVRQLLDRGDHSAVLQGFLDGLSPDDELLLRRLLRKKRP
jgi:predicted transcriptional regulator